IQMQILIQRVPTTKKSVVPGSTSTCNPNIQSNSMTLFDITKRTNYNFDATYVFRAGGQHTLKGGYQRSNLFNQIRNERSGGYVNFYYDQTTPASCTVKQTDVNCRETYGYYSTNIVRLEAIATSNNKAIFIQDSC